MYFPIIMREITSVVIQPEMPIPEQPTSVLGQWPTVLATILNAKSSLCKNCLATVCPTDLRLNPIFIMYFFLSGGTNSGLVF